MADDGIIKHKLSGMCVAPESRDKVKAHEKSFLVFTAKCDGWASFQALDNGMVQHVKTKMCIHYKSSEPVPPNDVPLVLYPDCTSSTKQRFQWFEESQGEAVLHQKYLQKLFIFHCINTLLNTCINFSVLSQH